jgi:hypothetical protein
VHFGCHGCDATECIVYCARSLITAHLRHTCWRMDSTNTGGSHWVKLELKVVCASRNRLMVAHARKCGHAIICNLPTLIISFNVCYYLELCNEITSYSGV